MHRSDISIFLISQVFGAFLSTDLIERNKHDSEGLAFFGTGECFVFTVRHIASLFFLNPTVVHTFRFNVTCIKSVDFVSSLSFA